MLGLAAALVGEGAEQGDGPRPGVGSDQGPFFTIQKALKWVGTEA